MCLEEDFDVNQHHNSLEHEHSIHVETSWDCFVLINWSPLISNEIYIDLITGWLIQSGVSDEEKNTTLKNRD